MISKRKLLVAKISLVVGIIPAVIYGSAFGPIPYVTGDLGDGGATCNQSGCHEGTAVNVLGAGSVTIKLPGSATYVPGQTQQISVTIADAKQRAWGFELTARFQSTNAQAGSLASTDGFTFVQCFVNPITSGPCSGTNTQFIEHTMPKTGAGSGTFTFNWTPPSAANGPIVLYAAGNAANGDGSNAGDHIYTNKIILAPGSSLATTTTTLTSSTNPSPFGQNFTLIGTVAPSTATGTVTFNDGSTALGTAVLSGGTATLLISACLAAAPHSITAVYSGDANNTTSTSAVLTETVNQGTPAPVIKYTGVVPLFSTSNTIQSASWISIYGCNLASAFSVWAGPGYFPTSLGDVSSVSIDHNFGYIWFVSAGQINVQVPNDTFTGPVSVTVTNANGTSNAVTVTLAKVAPSLLLFDGTHSVGVIITPDGSGFYDANGNPAAAGTGVYDLLGPKGAFAFNTRPARKGETVELFGVGFGPTQTPAPAGQAITPSLIASPIAATLGGSTASVGAAIVAAGEYQVNVTIPANAPSGDQPLIVTVGGVPAPTVLISVQ